MFHSRECLSGPADTPSLVSPLVRVRCLCLGRVRFGTSMRTNWLLFWPSTTPQGSSLEGGIGGSALLSDFTTVHTRLFISGEQFACSRKFPVSAETAMPVLAPVDVLVYSGGGGAFRVARCAESNAAFVVQ